MALGSYRVPAPFKDEDKWLRYFTKKSLCYMIVALFIGAGQFMFFKSIHMTLIGMTLFTVIMIGSAVLAFGVMPADKYLFGGGENVDTLLVRLIHKNRKKNKRVYVKNYGEDN